MAGGEQPVGIASIRNNLIDTRVLSAICGNLSGQSSRGYEAYATQSILHAPEKYHELIWNDLSSTGAVKGPPL